MIKVSEWFKNQQQKFNEGLQKRGPSMLQNLWNDWTGITNLNKSLEAQSIENAKAREYNLELAKKQNQWNIAQWNRENAFNSPSAQKGRLEAAGLNADLMYGAGGISNVAASSPTMTSGAPATPMDWSSLANKPSLSESIDRVLNQEMMRAQIDKVKSETKAQDIDNNIRDFEREIVDVMRQEGYQGTFAKARASLEEYTSKLAQKNFETESKKYEYLEDELLYNKEVRNFMRELRPRERDMFEASVRSAVANADIQEFLNAMKEIDFWSSKSMEAIETIIGGIGALKGFKVPSPKDLKDKFKHMTVEGNVVTWH